MSTHLKEETGDRERWGWGLRSVPVVRRDVVCGVSGTRDGSQTGVTGGRGGEWENCFRLKSKADRKKRMEPNKGDGGLYAYELIRDI